MLIPFMWWGTRVVSLFLHELAHAAAGRLGGIGIEEVLIGHGRELACVRIGATTFRIGWKLQGGMVVPRPALFVGKPAELAFIAAGPTSDVGVAVMAGWIYAAGLLPAGLAWMPIAVLCAQLHKLYYSAMPRDVHIYGEYRPNDCKLFIQTWRSPAITLGPFWQHYLARLCQYWNGDPPAPVLSAQSARIVALLYPRSPDADSFPTQDRIETLEKELDGPAHPAEIVHALDYLITHGLYAGRSDLLPQLDAWSSRAIALRPDLATLRGSRAAVLALLGRHDEALVLLAEADYSNSFNMVLNGLFTALALSGKGLQQEALDKFASALQCYDGARWPRRGDIWGLVERTARTIGVELTPLEAEAANEDQPEPSAIPT